MNNFATATTLAVGRVRYPPGGTFGPRVQRTHQVIWINSGWALVADDRATVRLEPGQAMVLIPGCTNRFRFAEDQDTDHGWCEALPAAVPTGAGVAAQAARGQAAGDAFAQRLAAVEHRVFACSPRIAELADVAALFKDDRRPGAPAVYRQIVIALFLEFMQIAGLAADSPLPRAIDQAVHGIERDYAEDWDLGRLAAAAAVSKQHLNRLFRAHLQVSAVEYLWRVRTERAAELVASTGLSLDEIAGRCGFRNGFHVSRRVKALFGRAPAALRRTGLVPS